MTGEEEFLKEVDEELPSNLPGNPIVIPRSKHKISRRDIDQDALKVMFRLISNGHQAFLVGGGVRDLLLGKRPKDFDVATDAKPEVVRTLFRNSRIIGRRFRINHVYFRGGKIIEVATFRSSSSDQPETLNYDNTYGDAETDAFRRDLTINGLFYDPKSYCVIDYVGGMADLESRVIRIIGDPDVRFQEDPVRMIRAVRHSARTGFEIEAGAAEAIKRHAELIRVCPIARIYEEFLRELREGYAEISIHKMREYGLLRYLMRDLDIHFENGGEDQLHVERTLARFDEYVKDGVEVPVPVLFLALSIDNFAFESNRDRNRSKRIIDQLFRPVGVSKRDREEMEGVLQLAFNLFSSFQAGGKGGDSLVKKHELKMALLLIELTVNNELGEECLSYWRKREVETHLSRHSGRRRNRRREKFRAI